MRSNMDSVFRNQSIGIGEGFKIKRSSHEADALITFKRQLVTRDRQPITLQQKMTASNA